MTTNTANPNLQSSDPIVEHLRDEAALVFARTGRTPSQHYIDSEQRKRLIEQKNRILQDIGGQLDHAIPDCAYKLKLGDHGFYLERTDASPRVRFTNIVEKILDLEHARWQDAIDEIITKADANASAHADVEEADPLQQTLAVLRAFIEREPDGVPGSERSEGPADSPGRLTLRPSLAAFAQEVERQLRDHEHQQAAWRERPFEAHQEEANATSREAVNCIRNDEPATAASNIISATVSVLCIWDQLTRAATDPSPWPPQQEPGAQPKGTPVDALLEAINTINDGAERKYELHNHWSLKKDDPKRGWYLVRDDVATGPADWTLSAAGTPPGIIIPSGVIGPFDSLWAVLAHLNKRRGLDSVETTPPAKSIAAEEGGHATPDFDTAVDQAASSAAAPAPNPDMEIAAWGERIVKRLRERGEQSMARVFTDTRGQGQSWVRFELTVDRLIELKRVVLSSTAHDKREAVLRLPQSSQARHDAERPAQAASDTN